MKKEEIKRCIRYWLERNTNNRRHVCPFGCVSLYCNICAKAFPSLSDGHGWIKQNNDPCPCQVLTYKYVIKRAKQFLKEGFKND